MTYYIIGIAIATVVAAICWDILVRNHSRVDRPDVSSWHNRHGPLNKSSKPDERQKDKVNDDIHNKSKENMSDRSLNYEIEHRQSQALVMSENLAQPVPPISANRTVSQSTSESDRDAASPVLQITRPNDADLMPPPLRPSTQQPQATKNLSRLNNSPAASLRVPSNGLLSANGPRGLSLPRTSLTATGNPVKPSKKVVLEPGYSAIDWAALNSSPPQPNPVLTGLPENLRPPLRIPPSQLKMANGRKGAPAWSSYQGKVYNIEAYRRYHPGGEKELMRAAGRDGEPLFREIHPWVNWEGMLSGCLVGYLVQERQ